jgi:ornithine cyclodeaminase
VKIINVAPGNAARGLPGLHGSYTLFDAATGRPLALLDADALTARRTVAASALAAGYLARPDASRLLVVGAGRLAALLPAAHRAVRPIRQVRVWARRPEAAAALVARWQTEGFDAEAATDLQAALGAADIVSCATLATEPLVQGAWLAPGAHLDLIGGFTPAMREADDDCFRGARLAIDTEEALTKAGDLLGPVSRGVFTAADVRATLAQLCRGSVPGRTQERQRTVFKSVGTALEDLAAARLVWRTLGPAPAA